MKNRGVAYTKVFMDLLNDPSIKIYPMFAQSCVSCKSSPTAGFFFLNIYFFLLLLPSHFFSFFTSCIPVSRHSSLFFFQPITHCLSPSVAALLSFKHVCLCFSFTVCQFFFCEALSPPLIIYLVLVMLPFQLVSPNMCVPLMCALSLSFFYLLERLGSERPIVTIRQIHKQPE